MSKQYLAYIREINKAKISVCYYCKSQSTGINAVAERIIFVCNTHYIPDNPNVIHRIYPQGMDYPEAMLDPNIGGSRATEPVENSSKSVKDASE